MMIMFEFETALLVLVELFIRQKKNKQGDNNA